MFCCLIALSHSRPTSNNEILPESIQEVHHRVKREDEPVRRKKRPFTRLNDEQLYRYIQLRTLLRYVLYHPKPEE
jgi:hypothetical protein